MTHGQNLMCVAQLGAADPVLDAIAARLVAVPMRRVRSLDDVAVAAQQLCSTAEFVQTLAIVGHGQPGALQVGYDATTPNHMKLRCIFTVERGSGAALTRLARAGLLRPTSEVLLLGCNVGRGPAGVALARRLGCRVGLMTIALNYSDFAADGLDAAVRHDWLLWADRRR